MRLQETIKMVYETANKALQLLLSALNQLATSLSQILLPTDQDPSTAKANQDILDKLTSTQFLMPTNFNSHFKQFLRVLDKIVQPCQLSVITSIGLNTVFPLPSSSASFKSAAFSTHEPGKLDANLPGAAEVLDCGCDPTTLADWFDHWKLWWCAALSVPKNTVQLISLIRMKLVKGWMRELHGTD